MKFEDAVRESVLSHDASVIWIETLDITSAELSAPIRVMQGFESLVIDGEKYQAYPFKIELPSVQEKTNSIMVITIDDVDDLIIKSARAVSMSTTPVETLWRQWRYKDGILTLASRFVMPMDISGIERTVTRTESGIRRTIKATCEHLDLLNKEIASEKYTVTRFKGLAT